MLTDRLILISELDLRINEYEVFFNSYKLPPTLSSCGNHNLHWYQRPYKMYTM